MNGNQYGFLESLPLSGLIGVSRNLCVQSLLYPFDVIKTRQHSDFTRIKSWQIAMNIFHSEGYRAFYRGLHAQMLRTSVQPLWSWPMMTEGPTLLKRYDLNPFLIQGLIGCSIATVGTALLTPLERAKINLILSSNKKNPNRVLFPPEFIRSGWKGAFPHWLRLTASWSTFLIAQKYFRDECKKRSGGDKLTLGEAAEVALKIAIPVTLITAPFDRVNTLVQSNNSQLYTLFIENVIRKLYRGWPLLLLSSAIHNTATIYLLDRFEN